MKARQQSPIHTVFSRPDKFVMQSHTSKTTEETSERKMKDSVDRVKQQIIQKQKQQSQTIRLLRKQIKNIKNEVVKLIEEGFVQNSTTSQWLESSGNMSSLSKSSKISGIMTSDFYGPNQGRIRKRQSDLSNSVVSYQQMTKLREQCQWLHGAYLNKQRQQNELTLKYTQLQKQVNALRKCKQSLTKCIQILQCSLRQTNQQMRYYIQYSKKLQAEIEINKHEKETKQCDYYAICHIKERLEEELGYRKAQNNELIKIIQIKEVEVEELRASFSQQFSTMQGEYRKAMQKLNTRDQKIKEGSYMVCEIVELQRQIQGLRNQLANRQQVMMMMLNDIRSMDKELLTFDQEHQQLIRCRKLIQHLNQQILKFDMTRLGQKYKYYY